MGELRSCFYYEIRDGREKLVVDVFWLSDDSSSETTACCASEVVVKLCACIPLCGQEMEIASDSAKVEVSYAQATSSDDYRMKVRASREWTGQETMFGTCVASMSVFEQASGAGNMHEHDVCWKAYQSDEIVSGYGLLHASAPEGDRGSLIYCVYVDAWRGKVTLAGLCISSRMFRRSNPENAQSHAVVAAAVKNVFGAFLAPSFCLVT